MPYPVVLQYDMKSEKEARILCLILSLLLRKQGYRNYHI